MRSGRRRLVLLIGAGALSWVMIAAALANEPARRFPTTRPAEPLERSNFAFMQRGYCYAASPVADRQAPGGFAPSDNLPRKLHVADDRKPGEVSLLALPEAGDVFQKKHDGMILLLVNGTDETATFQASDSRLDIIQEARDVHGRWKPIEYLPASWCGNSYHRLFLPAKHYWQFVAPRYTGTMQVMLRFRLERRDMPPVLSNEFHGSINPEQFTQKQGHPPTNIMDPYLE